MSAKVIAASVLVALLGVGGGLYVLTGRESDSAEPATQNSTVSTPEKPEPASEKTTDTTNESAAGSSEQASSPLTAAAVAEHATADDCWTIIDGNVYDITDYISRHPGGDNILSACGVDATAFFNGEKAGAEGDTKDHSSERQAASQLERMKLGALAQ